VPVTPSNIGIFQATTIAVLTAYGIDASHALAYGILLQAIAITTAVVLPHSPPTRAQGRPRCSLPSAWPIRRS
jgi:hypothetical protein